MAQLTTQITIAGNLTRDPEVRYTQSGQAVASFSVATTPRSYDRDTKQYVDGEAIFTNCTLWGKPAENFGASATKGSRVILAGSLKSRTYQTREGETKTATELVVDEVGMSVMFGVATVERGGGTRSIQKVDAPPVGAENVVSSAEDDDVPW